MVAVASRSVLFAALVLLAACQTPRSGFCAISSPIRLSSQIVDHLSDAEVRNILAHNRKGAALCGWS